MWYIAKEVCCLVGCKSWPVGLLTVEEEEEPTTITSYSKTQHKPKSLEAERPAISGTSPRISAGHAGILHLEQSHNCFSIRTQVYLRYTG